MKKFLGVFLKGVFILAPIVATFYIIYKVLTLIDGLFRGLLKKAGFYFPGLGALLTLAIILIVGVLASYWITNKVIKYFDKLLSKIPLIGTIYGIIKDTINSFSTNKKGFSRMVMIDLPNEMKLLGFLTNDEENIFIPKGYVAVYLMQSMQWAGNLVLIPEHMVKPVEASAEDALKFIASAGLLGAKEEKKE